MLRKNEVECKIYTNKKFNKIRCKQEIHFLINTINYAIF